VIKSVRDSRLQTNEKLKGGELGGNSVLGSLGRTGGGSKVVSSSGSYGQKGKPGEEALTSGGVKSGEMSKEENGRHHRVNPKSKQQSHSAKRGRKRELREKGFSLREMRKPITGTKKGGGEQ